MNQLVVRSSQLRMPRVLPQARPIDHRLWVLDTESNREGLGLDEYAASVEHAEGIAGAVSRSQNHIPAEQCCSVSQHHTFDPAVFNQQVSQLAVKSHLATHRYDFLPHRGRPAPQAKGPVVR